jgi:hypothetical protein
VKNILAWHMGGETLGHGDGRPVRVGERLDVPDPSRDIVCCAYGMHGYKDPVDMLALATGDWIRRVRLHEVRDRQSGKSAAPGRTALWELTPAQSRAVVVAFAQWCARRAKRSAARAATTATDATAAAYATAAAACATTAAAYAKRSTSTAAAVGTAAAHAERSAAYAADVAAYAWATVAHAAARDVERKAQARKLTQMLHAAHRAATRER